MFIFWTIYIGYFGNNSLISRTAYIDDFLNSHFFIHGNAPSPSLTFLLSEVANNVSVSFVIKQTHAYVITTHPICLICWPDKIFSSIKTALTKIDTFQAFYRLSTIFAFCKQLLLIGKNEIKHFTFSLS